VRGVKRTHLINSWGAARSGGRNHQGIDIFAARGTEITSTTRGIVVTVGHSPLGGRIVRVLGPAAIGIITLTSSGSGTCAKET
jgi:murein DD-endopeptidase MepM/ murein hydrolase activator NlpD